MMTQFSTGKPSDLAWVPSPIESEKPDEPIPETWTPAHVARRLVEAFGIDDRMSRIERPKDLGSAHPAVEADEPERDAEGNVIIDKQALAMAKERYDEAPNRFPPSRDEIAVMEAAFGWLLFLRESDPDAQFALKHWARLRQKCRKDSAFCRANGIARQTFISRKDRALAAVSSRLNAESAHVW